jgi:hypothetical protein
MTADGRIGSFARTDEGSRVSIGRPWFAAGVEVKMRMVSPSRPWTAAEDETLRALAIAGRNAAYASKQLNRTEAALTNRASKLGIRFGKAKSRGLGARKNEKPAPQ